MKIRSGFVSNSSSSSFVCEVCGGIESGFDSSYEELGMCECENEHTLHIECIPGCKGKYYDHSPEEMCTEGGEWNDNALKKEYCPICSMKSISEDDLNRYILKEIGKDKKTLEDEIRNRFANLEEFMKYLNEKE